MTRAALRPVALRGRLPTVALSAVLLLGACGSSNSSAPRSNAASRNGNSLASKSPAQIIAAAQSALRSARGFVMTASVNQNGKALRLQIVEGGPSKLQMRVDESGETVEMIALRGAGYIRVNPAYLTVHGGDAASVPANRWIQVPLSMTQALEKILGQFAPNTVARCLGEDHGTLRLDGTTTVNGQPAVVINAAGNVPGSSPGTLAIATSGPAYPLRTTTTGRRRPGGKVDACNTGKGSKGDGSATLSDFNHTPAVRAPNDLFNPPATPSLSN
jgi:hypothetical protein